MNPKPKRLAAKNNDYQKLLTLKTNRNKRHKYGEFIVEGVRNIEEAVKNLWKIEAFVYAFDKPLSKWAADIIASAKTTQNIELPFSFMQELSEKTDTSELIAVVKMKSDDISRLPETENPIYVVFDRPSNKGNLGTIIRSCDAFGINGLILFGHSVDLYDPEVIVSSMGSFFNFTCIRIAENNGIVSFIDKLRIRHSNMQVIATTAHSSKPLMTHDFSSPAVLLIGNETSGLCNALYELSDLSVTIPMNSIGAATSFNVACAATVVIYEAVRNRIML